MHQNLSLQILALVNQHACNHLEKPEETVNRAKLYQQFIEGSPEQVNNDVPPVVPNAPEPGSVRRKRRTKAEMEAARSIGAVAEVSISPGATVMNPIEAVQVATVSEIQATMLKLFDREFGMDAAREILDSYGVKKVIELKPDQYNSCLQDLQEALNDEPMA